MAKISRRELLKTSGTYVAVGSLGAAGFAESSESDTRLTLKQLLDRGHPEVYSGQELQFIGMPVGGLFAGTVYLGGDGQLWNWDIFNQERLGCVEREPTVFLGDTLNAMGGANYVDPVRQKSPFFQQFQLIVEGEKPKVVRFGDIRFRGEYPIGRVAYAQADADVEMTLEAMSPFCPLNVESSSYPATTMTFQVKNVGEKPLDLRLQYVLDNPVLCYSKRSRSDFDLAASGTPGNGLLFSATPKPIQSTRDDILFENWSSGTYGQWVKTGTALGDAPQQVANLPTYMGPVKAETEFVVNTHQTRNGEDVVAGDAHTGTLTSTPFVIQRNYINLRVGGGGHAGQTCVNLLIGGKVVRTVTGRNSNAMNWESWLVSELEGKEAVLQVVDNYTGGWGQILLGEIVFSDKPCSSAPLQSLQDHGSFCVQLVNGANHLQAKNEKAEMGRRFRLEPGKSQEVTFVVAWHFPNCASNLPGKRHWYASKWKDAAEVASDLISKWSDLRDITRAWNRTWYDSTLPYWFLDRTFINTSILATTTCYRLDKGRFYFWEGVGCCAGTCTHVWGYAQAIGRVFPEVERYLRSEIDFGLAYRKETGAIDYRAEYHQTVAHDGQASCILRAYREHQMSQDDRFLRSIWPQVKGAMEYLIKQDVNGDGILDGAQYNTLDTAWYGEIAWISSLYVAALRAAAAMATELGDAEFAKTCAALAESGSTKLVADLFNGEYFINHADPAHPEANNTRTGCHIDQLYGQAWAHQVGLPRVVPAKESRIGLKSLFKYNFVEDVWEYRRRNRDIPGGRWYATPGEPGLIMCSFPKGGAAASIGKSADAWAVGYFNECMSGFEYQAAAHMIAEGLVEEGLRVVHAIHARYHPSKRNPYNEIECSDHYGRAMASYGCFVSACGFSVNGPKGTMSFSPKVSPQRFRCAFINERGWGTFERDAKGEKVQYVFKEGQLA